MRRILILFCVPLLLLLAVTHASAEVSECHKRSSYGANPCSSLQTSERGSTLAASDSLASEVDRRPELSCCTGQAARGAALTFTVRSASESSACSSPSISEARSGSTPTPTLSALSAKARTSGPSESRLRTDRDHLAPTRDGRAKSTSIASMDAHVRRLASYLRRLMQLSSSSRPSAAPTAYHSTFRADLMGSSSPPRSRPPSSLLSKGSAVIFT